MLADNGMKVLAVDLDKQGDTTNALLSEDESEYSDNGKNVLDFFRGDAAFEDVVKKNYTKKLVAENQHMSELMYYLTVLN